MTRNNQCVKYPSAKIAYHQHRKRGDAAGIVYRFFGPRNRWDLTNNSRLHTLLTRKTIPTSLHFRLTIFKTLFLLLTPATLSSLHSRCPRSKRSASGYQRKPFRRPETPSLHPLRSVQDTVHVGEDEPLWGCIVKFITTSLPVDGLGRSPNCT